MTLNPKVSMWLNIAAVVLMAIVGCGSMFTDLIGTAATVKVMAGVGILGSVVNAVLHMIPSQNGPDAAKLFALGPSK
jgi:hypothetical protein